MNTSNERKNATIRVGSRDMNFIAVPMEEAKRKAEAIQEKVQPLINEQKRQQKAAEKAVSKIILNA